MRLIGIDTPETVRPGVEVECGGPEAAAAMHRFDGRRVRLLSDPTQDGEDSYGRQLRYAEVRGRDLGRVVVKAGLASVYVYDGMPFERVRSYRRAAARAQALGRGVWSLCGGNFHSGEAMP